LYSVILSICELFGKYSMHTSYEIVKEPEIKRKDAKALRRKDRLNVVKLSCFF
jgi:hypothetical protein